MKLEKYIYLNLCAKEYLMKELDVLFCEKYQDDEMLKRCHQEMEILFAKGLLFIIEILYNYKQTNPRHGSYHFRGTINNLLLLYVLGITSVDPIKYRLPYELFNDSYISVDLINDSDLGLIWFIEEYNHNVKLIYGTHKKECLKEAEYEGDYYLLIPGPPYCTPDIKFRLNKLFLFETVEEYWKYKNEFLIIRISEKQSLSNDCIEKGLENVLTCDFEKRIAGILDPKTIQDYIKIKSIGHGTDVWNYNQEALVKEGKINIANLIATREDIFEYLLDHSIDRDMALEILNFIRKGRQNKEPKKWDKYVRIMKKHDCEDMFIDIFSKILFIFGRGQAVSECLFVLDKENYI